jgi:hypothetical protein
MFARNNTTMTLLDRLDVLPFISSLPGGHILEISQV